jgi:hypothetical protein
MDESRVTTPLRLNCEDYDSSQRQSHIATDGQSVSKSWCRAPSRAHDQIFITMWQLLSCYCGAPSLTRGRVCLLYGKCVLSPRIRISIETCVSEPLPTNGLFRLSGVMSQCRDCFYSVSIFDVCARGSCINFFRRFFNIAFSIETV